MHPAARFSAIAEHLVNFCVMLLSLFMKLQLIVGNTCGHVLVNIIFYGESLHVIEKSARLSFLGQCI